MSTRQRVLIGIGCFILAAMMLLGAYSAGYYAAYSRAPTPPLTPPVPEGPRMPGPLAQWPQGVSRPDVIGVVVAKSQGLLVIRTRGGPRNVAVSQDTKILLPAGQEAGIADILRGAEVGVIGTFEGGGVLAAEVVVVIQRRPDQ